MSQNWFLLAFGVELGPMSWDDLRERAAKGDLKDDSRIREGENGEFKRAGDVPGLFAVRGEQADAPTWYCEVFGSELGPMTWKDLCQLAAQGTLRKEARVRQGAEVWQLASSVAGLIQTPLVATAPAQAPVKTADAPLPQRLLKEPPNQQTVSRQSEMDAGPTAVPDVASVIAPAPTERSAKAVSQPDKRPVKERKAHKREFPRPQIRLHVPRKMLAAAAVLALAACVGYGGVKLLPSGPPAPDPRQVASAYQHVYEEVKQARTSGGSPSLVGLQFQLSRRIAALRAQIENSTLATSATDLGEAGTQLSLMVANCQGTPGSPEETKFVESEKRFLSLLNALDAPH